MQVKVLLFAQLADAMGQDGLSLDLPEAATVADALAELSRQHPPIADLDDRLAVAVNESYASPATPLNDGATIALIPPVSGG